MHKLTGCFTSFGWGWARSVKINCFAPSRAVLLAGQEKQLIWFYITNSTRLRNLVLAHTILHAQWAGTLSAPSLKHVGNMLRAA
jgi:hypothetical protein